MPYIPSPALRPFVKQILVTETVSESTQTLLPDTGLVMAFRLGGSAHMQDGLVLPDVAVTGLRDSARTITRSGNARIVLARFTETGGAGFLRQPVDRLFNSILPLESMVPHSRLNRLREQLAEPHTVATLETFLIERLNGYTPDSVVSAATLLTQQARGAVRVLDLASMLGLSQSALERRFRAVVGTTPKKFASLVRLKHVLRLGAESRGRLTDLAYAAGYSDQAHFTKDFKKFTSSTPEMFFAQPLPHW
jgi:AraC-like DNA-binding protein